MLSHGELELLGCLDYGTLEFHSQKFTYKNYYSLQLILFFSS